MKKPVILCVDDQREVLAALLKDLDELGTHLDIVDAESAAEAEDVLSELRSEGQPIALIISDQVMPGRDGVTFLTGLANMQDLRATRKLLLTGLATHEDTIRAINEAKIDSYIPKPWTPEALLGVVRNLLTGYVLDAMPDDYGKMMPIMDQEALYAKLAQRGAPSRE